MTAERLPEPRVGGHAPRAVPSPAPRVSVIMPARNEASGIQATVRSVLAQHEPPGGFELIVVDGASDDGTRAELDRLAEEDERVVVLDNPRRITAAAFNLGIRAARGDVIVLMGAHNVYAPDYLVESVRALEETGADNVGGAMETVATTRTQRAIAAAHHSPFAVGGARWHDPAYEGRADTVFGGAYRRTVFERIGLFDEELVRNQDDELNFRLCRAGGTIWQTPRIRSSYRPRASLAQLWRQYRQYGYWKVRVIQKHRLPSSVRHLVPAAFVLALFGLPLVAGASAAIRPLIDGPLTAIVAAGALGLHGAAIAAYLVALVAASLLTARARGWDLLPLLPLVFACYHLSYGLGFIEGVRDFVLLKRGPGAAQQALSR